MIIEEKMKVKLPKFECQRCGHKWSPRKEAEPVCCGFCKSPRWDSGAIQMNGGPRITRAHTRHAESCLSCRRAGA